MKESISNFADKLLDVLLEIHALRDYGNRSMLLRHLPPGPVGFVERFQATAADLNSIVMSAESWGQLVDSGEWALAIVARNALRFAKGTIQGNALELLLASLETVPLTITIPPVKEIVIGRDERLPISFLEKALTASRSVARILVPRVFEGARNGSFVYGTGWLIAPGLLVTNHHVVAAREAGESPVSDADLQTQVAQMVVWFDYQERDKSYVEYRCEQCVCADPSLDYSLLRLNDQPTSDADVPVSDWGYLSVHKQIPPLNRGERLNIIQHPQGGPKRLAIRSNFYVDSFSDSVSLHRLRYLTDTEPGSSGSPVFDDSWQVVGLHEAAIPVPRTQYKGEVVKYNNQGVFVSTILNSLPREIYDEIARSQQW